MAEASNNEKKKISFFRGVKREWKKITWPTWNDVLKETVVVTLITAVTSILIGLIDMAVKAGINFISSL